MEWASKEEREATVGSANKALRVVVRSLVIVRGVGQEPCHSQRYWRLGKICHQHS
jgi:hypothetical protein